MKKINLFFAIVLIALPFTSYGKQALTKELLTSFQQVALQWQALEAEYPELSASLDESDISQPEKIIAQLETSKAYPKIKSILANSEFANLEEYYDVATRLMGGMMSYQMQKMPQGMDLESMEQMLKSNIAQMKASNVPESMIAELEKQLGDIEKNMKKMKSAMVNTSAADKKFISDNAQWIMSILEEI
ncbi:MAG: hypothetical protein OQK09_00595 [Colwellia sp.]|nr:hypothetical protein [Colwellia sp.]MCW8866528.1 hypothetical protein [Colwellia sp.]MCW9079986.1 hypothetical protein [Colwellia sp.]